MAHTEFTPEQEELLADRDERVTEEVKRVLQYKRELAREMRRDAAELERQALLIESAVRAGRWYALPDFGVSVETEDLESLCDISPDPADILGA